MRALLRWLGKLAALGFYLVVALSAYSFLKSGGFALLGHDAIAVVTVKGEIDDAQETVRRLERIARTDAIRAVVLRVDSPGGAVAPSQEIYDAVQRLHGKKPIIASLGNVAASGGYYIASACDAIVASPGTLTGSIGVIMQVPNLTELLKKVGLEGVTIKAGKFKDIGSPTRPMTDEEKRYLEALLANVHDQFIGAVAKGRNLPVDDVRKIADGRIYSGQQALDIHLVDKLGGLREAVDLAAERAGITGEPQRIEFEEKESSWIWKRVSGLMPNAPRGFGGLQFLYSGPGAGG